jgi:hypothetical protein
MLGEEKDPKWMQNLWRPAMGWMYMFVCLCDMVIFPVLWSLLQAMVHGAVSSQWDPLTLRGAGLFHLAMGAVLGIAAFGRTQEKLAGTAANPMANVTTQNVNMTGNTQGGYGSNTGGTNNFNGGGFNTAPAFGNSPAFGSTPAPSFGAPAPTFGTTGASCPTTGKPLGPNQSFPAL